MGGIHRGEHRNRIEGVRVTRPKEIAPQNIPLFRDHHIPECCVGWPVQGQVLTSHRPDGFST
jgi:hypothetical protein